MSRKATDAGDDKKENAKSVDLQSAEDAGSSSCGDEDSGSGNEDNGKSNSKDNTDTSQQDNNQSNDNNDQNTCKIWLEVLPSKGGILLAALLTEIMTEGMTPSQMNILGNFVSAVGSLISYKAARDDLDVNNN